ncbi:MAG: glycosyltransferase [Bacteroidota bacterium]
MQKKKVIVSVINDLTTDQRVARTCSVFIECHFEVTLIGRIQKNSKPISDRVYKCIRMKLFFEKGVLFYIFFNIRLFFILLFTKADLLYANDLDTLLPNFLVSKLKGSKLIYDSHEIFCEVPELVNHPIKKWIWESLEKWIIPKLKNGITVNESIANYFTNKYNLPFIYVRNIPNYGEKIILKSRKVLGLPEKKYLIILQGAGINVQRGAEELLESFKYLNDNYALLIIGAGDVINQLKLNANKFQLKDKIIFIDKLSALELRQYTINSDLGVTIDKDSNLNYHFSLPNKVFDYIHAGLPILASKLPEIESIIHKYNIGVFINKHYPKHIAEQIEKLMNSSDYKILKQNTILAASENNWQNEKQKLIKLFNQV